VQLAYVGIVDILTEYSAIKRIENLVLDPFLAGISCQPPDFYAKRLAHTAFMLSRLRDFRDLPSLAQPSHTKGSWLISFPL
jgi:hypothetical protein